MASIGHTETRSQNAAHGCVQIFDRCRPLVHGLALLVCLCAYGLLVGRYTIELEVTQICTEAPLLLYLFLLFRAPLQDRFRSSLVAACPIVWFYVVHDAYFLKLRRTPDLADFALLHDLLATLDRSHQLLLIAFLGAPVVLWLSALELRRWPRFQLLVLGLPALLAASWLLAAPTRAYNALSSLTVDEEWSDGVTADHWGRIYSAFFREVRRRSFTQSLDGFTPLAQSTLHLSPELLGTLDKRNVHMIVLESFIDVRLLENVRFSEPPLFPHFTLWSDPYVSSSISPSFGGETARAEFELLCGVPSLRLYGLEFLAFTGAPTYCLPQILHDAGYVSVLTFPHGPVFFNTRRAYPGLGFDERIFGDKYADPGREHIEQHGESYVSDAELFPQNLAKVERLLQAGRPFLNYVLTIYGHWDFQIDPHGDPPALEASVPAEDLHRVSVMMHQRTQALDGYIQRLRELDPHSVIVLISDHLPPLSRGTLDYERYGYHPHERLPLDAAGQRFYENFLLVLIDGQPRKLPQMRHFDLPRWVLDQLSHGAYCKVKRCDFGRLPLDAEHYLDEYRTVLGLAARAP